MSDDTVFFQNIADAISSHNDEGMIALVGKQFAHRIEAHRGSYQMAAQSALVSAYPVVERLVGEEYMHALAQAFVGEHPPKSASLTLYGDLFPGFLRKFAPVQKDLPWLSAVAELDKTWFDVYGAMDANALDAKDLAGQDFAVLPILAPGLHPSSRILRFKIPAYSIWRTNKLDADIQQVDLTKGSQWAAFWRQDNVVNYTQISQAEYVFLTNIEAGKTLAVSYAESVRFDRQFDLQQQFSRWLSAGVFKGS